LEELATGVSSGGGGDAEGTGLKLRDGASETRKDGNGLSHKAPNVVIQNILTRTRRRSLILVLLIAILNHPLPSFPQRTMTLR
jgi:hypothetical protein